MKQPEDSLPMSSSLSFESLKKHTQHGTEYWSARELQSCLGYSEWRKFENTVKTPSAKAEGFS